MVQYVPFNPVLEVFGGSLNLAIGCHRSSGSHLSDPFPRQRRPLATSSALSLSNHTVQNRHGVCTGW